MQKNCLIATLCISLSAGFSAPLVYAQSNDDNSGIGQTVQINTHFSSWLGKPTWTLVLYDVEHGQYIPYMFEIGTAKNSWVAFSYGRTFRIAGSTMKFVSFDARHDRYRMYKINDFCHLQTGRNIRDESLYISVDGDLSPYSNTYTCNVIKFPESNFTIVPPEDDSSN